MSDKKKGGGGGKDKDQKKSKAAKAVGDRFEDAYKGSSKVVDILDDSAMENALNICHNVQVNTIVTQAILFFRILYLQIDSS